MPNWCNNDALLIAPTKEHIDLLVAALQTEDKSEKFFNVLRPRPESHKDHWYEWNTENWGTKWDAEPYSFERIDDETLQLSFDTAWGPPIALYEYLEEQGWSVQAKYHECGMAFVGMFSEGIDYCWEYDFEDEESIDAIPEDLNEWAGISESYNMHKEESEDENGIE